MTRRYAVLAWTAAACTYVLIILGAVVRITGSGMGCGDHWPLCNGHLFPPLGDIGTVIEWSHRLVAGLVAILVVALAAYTWWERRGRGGVGSGEWSEAPPHIRPSAASYSAAFFLVVQIALGAVTVKLALPPWTVILHLGTAMLLLASLLVAARGVPLSPGWRPGSGVRLVLGFATVLMGALTANLGAASACLGFPLCNGQVLPDGNYLQHIHWTHRLLAYALTATVAVWAARSRARGPRLVLALVGLQVVVAAAMVLGGLPGGLQAIHVAVGAAVWAALVLTAL
jgi:heme A synthase